MNKGAAVQQGLADCWNLEPQQGTLVPARTQKRDVASPRNRLPGKKPTLPGPCMLPRLGGVQVKAAAMFLKCWWQHCRQLSARAPGPKVLVQPKVRTLQEVQHIQSLTTVTALKFQLPCSVAHIC